MKKKWTYLIILLIIAAAVAGAYNLMTGATDSPPEATEINNTVIPPAPQRPTEAAGLVQATLPASTAAMDGKALMEQRCSGCHSLDFIYGSRGTPQEWAYVVSIMKANGAVLNPQEEKVLDDYLARNFGQ